MSKNLLSRFEHKIYIKKLRKKLKNSNPTILSSNCNGGIVSHDLGCRFNSPTVNLYFDAAGFIKLLKQPDIYFNSTLVESKSDFDFPVGRLNDIYIYFMHYSSFEEAKEKWNERTKRIDMNNLFVIMTDKNGCTYDIIKEFDELPIKHKVIFTHKPYPEFKSACYIKGFENDGEVGILSDWKPGFWKRRWLDDFDSVAFLNGETY